jgi:hypothetical protein
MLQFLPCVQHIPIIAVDARTAPLIISRISELNLDYKQGRT